MIDETSLMAICIFLFFAATVLGISFYLGEYCPPVFPRKVEVEDHQVGTTSFGKPSGAMQKL